MLKKLRLKIILAIVLVAAVMLGAILGLFYTLTKQNLRTQSISMMQAIAADPFSPVQPGQEPQQVHLPYFVLQTDAFGNLVAIGSSEASQDAIGEIPEYSLRYCRVTGSVIFADISSEQQTLRTLLKTGALLVALGLLAFFGLAVLLAHSAVKPVEQAWRQQKQFVADASHELKTPLTVILTNTELLQSPDYDAAQKQTFLSGIDAMAKQMRALVERLLELARAENEQAACAFEPCDLSQITESSTLLFEAALFERGLTLQTELEADIMVSGDRRQLSQLVEIYLDNARKYASGGTVTVRLSRCGKNRCRLSVSNEGEAIAPQALRQIFDRFSRADAARTRDGSFGLGLSIAQAIAQTHGGSVWAESETGVNTFFAELPMRSGHEKRQEVPKKGI